MKQKPLSIPVRIIYFIIGLSILTVLMVYSIQWENLPFGIFFFSYNVTSIVFPAIFVLVSIIAGGMIMAGFDGKWRLR